MLSQRKFPQPSHCRLLPTPNSIPPQPQRRANPLFRGAIEQRAALSFGTFLFAVEKKSTLAAGQVAPYLRYHNNPQ
jgi:hypothetical protein